MPRERDCKSRGVYRLSLPSRAQGTFERNKRRQILAAFCRRDCRASELNRKNYAEHLDEDLYAETENSVFFATNGIGDYYCYKAFKNGDIDENTIYIREHETFEYHKVATDLAELIIKYYNDEI